jgi:hypothetical protein
MAYIEAENRLMPNDVYQMCCLDPMETSSDGPCGMGVDIGDVINVVVGYRKSEKTIKLIYATRVKTFQEVHDIGKRYSVQCAVLDLRPEERKVREFQEGESYLTYACEYKEHQARGPIWINPVDQPKCGLVTINRTELCDTSDNLFRLNGLYELPRQSSEIIEYATQMSNLAKVLETDKKTGIQVYRYRKLGPDHYRHATNYLWLACPKINFFISKKKKENLRYLHRRRDGRVI